MNRTKKPFKIKNFSDEYSTLYPYSVDKENEGGTQVFTKEEIEQMNVVTDIVSWTVLLVIQWSIFLSHPFQPPLKSIKLEDIINYIQTDIVILKIDVEGYECKALQPNIVFNELGKFIPYIFMEWGQLPTNNKTCVNFDEWAQNFYDGGYLPVNPGEGKQDFKLHKILF